MPAVYAGAVFVVSLHMPAGLMYGTELESVATYFARHSASREDAEPMLAIIMNGLGNELRTLSRQGMLGVQSVDCREGQHAGFQYNIGPTTKANSANGCKREG